MSKTLELVTKLSFEIFEIITEKEKVYSDGEFIKDCLELFTRRMFSEKKCLVKQLSPFQFTVATRIDDLSENIELSLKQ